jgi:hypothetical protein
MQHYRSLQGLTRNFVARPDGLCHAFAIAYPGQVTKMVWMNLARAFTEHPASVGESYSRHCVCAAGFGARMVVAGFACMIHALLPFLFVRTASRAIAELNERMIANRPAAPHAFNSTSRLPS